MARLTSQRSRHAARRRAWRRRGLPRMVVASTVGVDDDERGLGGDGEVLVQLAVAVGELRKRELVTVDEVLERVFVTGPGDAVGGDLAVPALGDQLDRTGFCVADRSSRRPEPQHHRLPGQGRPVELTAAEDLRTRTTGSAGLRRPSDRIRSTRRLPSQPVTRRRSRCRRPPRSRPRQRHRSATDGSASGEASAQGSQLAEVAWPPTQRLSRVTSRCRSSLHARTAR